MKKWIVILVGALFMLTACSDKEDAMKANVAEENTIGFEMMDGSIEEETDVPSEEKEKILAAFNEYIDSFNSKDIERYGNILSKNAQGFNYEEDLQYAKETFESYDVKREASDVTIVKYEENEAQVFSNVNTLATELASDLQHDTSGRQVTVFVKENGEWKVSSIYYIGNQGK